MRTVLNKVVIALALAASACGGGVDERSGGRPLVVASAHPILEVAKAVAGDDADVRALLPSGADPHDAELTTRQRDLLEDADVVLHLGRSFQPAVAEAVGERRGAIDLLSEEVDDHGGEEPDEHGGGAAEPDDRGTAEVDGHAHEGEDPHVWLDPIGFAVVVDRIAGALAAADPEGADAYAARADGLRAELVALDAEYREGLEGCARDELVTAHDAFGRLAGRYGLEPVPIAGLSPESEPDPARLAKLADRVRSAGATTVFAEAGAPRGPAEAVAREAGVALGELDPIERRVAGRSYLDAMRSNLAALRAALGCP